MHSPGVDPPWWLFRGLCEAIVLMRASTEMGNRSEDDIRSPAAMRGALPATMFLVSAFLVITQMSEEPPNRGNSNPTISVDYQGELKASERECRFRNDNHIKTYSPSIVEANRARQDADVSDLRGSCVCDCATEDSRRWKE